MPGHAPTSNLVNPFALKSTEGYIWLKGNLHSHTSNSDGRVSPQERVDGYVNQGYDFLCLSDHHHITFLGTVSGPDSFILIQGAELHPKNPFGGQTHHFVALNLKEDIDAQNMAPQAVINEVKQQGGSAWLAHPHWSSVIILRDTLPLKGLAGIEVFNTTCRCNGRPESGIHWDDWMNLEDKLFPAIATDDSHARDEENRDTYQGWTMVRVRDRSAQSIVEALERGASYSSTGPEIHAIGLRRADSSTSDRHLVEATIRCSKAQRILGVCEAFGTEYHENGRLFETATFTVRPNARWVRFEVIGPNGAKAWSNPFDLTAIA